MTTGDKTRFLAGVEGEWAGNDKMAGDTNQSEDRQGGSGRIKRKEKEKRDEKTVTNPVNRPQSCERSDERHASANVGVE